MTTTAADILDALDRYARQGPGLTLADLGDRENLRRSARSITHDLHHARELLAAARSCEGMTAERLLYASEGAFSGRLEIKPEAEGVRLHYTTGQWWPNEYRAAVCAVLASALWACWREQLPKGCTGDDIRKEARRHVSQGVARRWFK